MQLFLVRHGQQHHEATGRLDVELLNAYAMGEKQGPLTRRGQGQARRAAEALQPRGLTHVYASALRRAQETAAIAAEVTGLPVRTLTELGELRCGRLDPRAVPAVARSLRRTELLFRLLGRISPTVARHALGFDLIRLYFSHWLRGETLDGETPEQAAARIGGVVASLRANHAQADRVACVTHGYFIYYLVNFLLFPDQRWRNTLRRPYIRNASITELGCEGCAEWRLVAYADARHLAWVELGED